MSELARVVEDLAATRGMSKAVVIDRMAVDVFLTSPEEAYEVIERSAVVEDLGFVYDLKMMLALDEDEVMRLINAVLADFGRAEEEKLTPERGH